MIPRTTTAIRRPGKQVMKVVKSVAALLICFGVVAALFAYLTDGRVDSFLFGEDKAAAGARQLSWEFALVLSLVMAIGILFGSVYEGIGDRMSLSAFANVLRNAVTSGHFIKAILASPILFAVVYAAAQKQPDIVIAVLFAFENGFFCQAVLKAKTND